MKIVLKGITMVEVFKTNVRRKQKAKVVIDRIHEAFNGYSANFDLNDCDKILRIKYFDVPFQQYCLIELLKDLGVDAEVLPDEALADISH